MSESAQRVRQLAEWLHGTDIALLELTGPSVSIRLCREGEGFRDAPVAVVTTAEPTQTTVIRAGSVGVLRLTHPMRDKPAAAIGQRVAAGQALAMLQIGPLLLPVPAPRDGVVARVLAAEGSAVGYGDALVQLE